MLVETFKRPVDPSKTKFVRLALFCKFVCDECGIEFERRSTKKAMSSDSHFCSQDCKSSSMKVGGKLDEKRKTSCREKYGVDYVIQLDSTKARQRESMTEETVEKRQNTMLRRYGVKNALESPDIAEKIEKTCLERYGVDNPLKCRKIQEKIDNVLIKRYGSRNALAAPGAIDKRRSTWIENYGVDCPIRLESVLEKKKSTCLKKYGVDNPMKLEAMKVKVHETKKANGTYLDMTQL